MQLVKPSTEILFINAEALQLIEVAGRTCYKSDGKIKAKSAPRFAKMILKSGHESVIEHATATVRFICDRGVTHEIVRHRLASYSQESTRYCDYSNGHVAFVIPPWTQLSSGIYNIGWNGLFGSCCEMERKKISEVDRRYFWSLAVAERDYQELSRSGWRPEQARSVLPNSLKTEIVMTANLREWRHFFKLRTSAAAHPQMREVEAPLLEKMKARVPVIFDDLMD